MSTSTKPTDIHIASVSASYEDHDYRTAIKFGGVAVSEVTVLNVECEVVTRAGKSVRGFGSMPLANTWAFPSREMTFQQTQNAMRVLSERCARIC